MSADLLVIGGGIAGASAAISAAELGATVILIEKLPILGGSCIYSAGNLLEIDGPEALDHLVSLSFSRTPDDVLEAYLGGLAALRARLDRLGAKTFAVDQRMLPNCWPNSPGADGVTYYAVEGEHGGPALWDVLERALAHLSIEVRTETRMTGLVVEDGRVIGADILNPDGSTERIIATRGVVLATGGFENDPGLTDAYLPVPLVRPVGNPGTTGDGLRAAQEIGAAVWHMSAFYGFWAFSAPEYATSFPLLFFAPGHLMVDSHGRRFHAEVGREPHDAMRSVGDFLPHRENSPSLPAWVIFDQGLLSAGPLAQFPSATGYRWSADNSAEVESGWIVSAPDVAGLAEKLALDPARLAATIATYNAAACSGVDSEFGRDPHTMAPVDESRLYAIRVWPGVATTSGGPRRDSRARILGHDLAPIAGLYAAGNTGGVWGHLTEHGGGLTDGLVFGDIAARDALGAGAART